MQERDKRIQIMQDAPPLKAIFTMSIPVILGMMVNVVYNLVDTWFIGMMGDELLLAASSYCTPIFVIISFPLKSFGKGSTGCPYWCSKASCWIRLAAACFCSAESGATGLRDCIGQATVSCCCISVWSEADSSGREQWSRYAS